MNSWELEIKKRRIQEIDRIEKSVVENLHSKLNALENIEKAFLSGEVTEEIVKAARNKLK